MIYATNSRKFIWIRKWYFQIRADECLDKLHEFITLMNFITFSAVVYQVLYIA